MFTGNDWRILKNELNNLKGYELSDLCYILDLPYSGTISQKMERIHQVDSDFDFYEIIYKINLILFGEYIIDYFYAEDLAEILRNNNIPNPRRKWEKCINIIKNELISPRELLGKLYKDDLKKLFYEIYEEDSKLNKKDLINSILQYFNLIEDDALTNKRKAPDLLNTVKSEQFPTSGETKIENMKILSQSPSKLIKQKKDLLNRIFISYSWDNIDHKLWVLKLASDLLRNGIDIIIDEWNLQEYDDDLQLFMESGIRDSNFVIIISTPNYVKKANRREGGVGIENTIITGEYFDGKKSKYLPIIRSGKGSLKNYLPTYLKTKFCYDFRDDKKYNEELENVIRKIYKVPKIKKPQLGKKPDFQSMEIETYLEQKKESNHIQNKIINEVDKPKIEVTFPKLTKINSWDSAHIQKWLKHPIDKGEGHNDFLYKLQGKVHNAPLNSEVRIWVNTNGKWPQIGSSISEKDGSWQGKVFLTIEDKEKFTKKERTNIGIDLFEIERNQPICSEIFTIR